MAKVEIKTPDFDVNGLQEEILLKVGGKIVEHAVNNAPSRTGNYKSQISYDGGNEVVAHAKYSAAIEYGFDNYEETVREHQRVIKKAFGKELNPPVIATVKEHTRKMNREPNPVMRNAAAQTQKEIPQIVGQILKEHGL